MKVSNLKGSVKDSGGTFDINFTAQNALKNPDVCGTVYLKSFNLPVINEFAHYSIIPKEFREYLNLVRFDKGRINLNCRINHNKVNAYTDLGGLKFTYTPMNLPVQIINGSLIMRNNDLRLNKINLLIN